MPRKPNPAFMRMLQPSDQLAAVVGAQPMPRTEVTKKLWEYIKSHHLQDAQQKRMINADANLQPIFGAKTQVNMFELPKILSPHLTPIAS